ncbi:MAG: Glucose/sorbosone dehydrogenase-like protein [Verrucomicrobiales bacterium]|nr:Glucose/sorbosone dehydrogenase-like protein [Verrucomicrobiales bacterium]
MRKLLFLIATVAVALSHGFSAIAQDAAKPAPKKKKAVSTEKPVPKHDPADLRFRAAPMASATRSIVIPLSTNLHLAFDAELLRTHVAWSGKGLNLFGPPYHDSSDRFICDFDGKELWHTPQVFPWSVGTISKMDLRKLPDGTRFKGVSTKDINQQTIVMYELAVGNGNTVRVHETPRAWNIGNNSVMERRLEIAACDKDLFLLAHAEHGTFLADRPADSPVIQRTNGHLLLRLWTAGEKQAWLICTNENVSYPEVLYLEKNGRGPQLERKTNTISGIEARVYIKIPAHEKEIAIQLASVVIDKNAERLGLELNLSNGTMGLPNLSSVTNRTVTAGPSRAKTFSGDNTIFPRVDGDKFYKIEHFPLPKEIDLKPTGMDFLPNGDLAVCTWAGDIYIVKNAQGEVRGATYHRFARGLMEPMGLKIINGQMYVTQKSELTRVTDTDGDGEADLFETINSGWAFTGRYNDFAFGPTVDKKGNFFVFRGGNGGSWDVPYMGWAVKITPNGDTLEPFCSGLRVPNGFATIGDDIFVTENQGNWIGGCKVNHLQSGKFYGFPSTQPSPKEQFSKPKSFAPPAVWIPYTIAKSSSGITVIEDEKFGPFKGQMLVGDFQMAIVTRVMLEKVNGEWQGAVWPFSKGFNSGVNRIAMGPDGKAYVGGCKGAHWAAVGPQLYSLDRVSFTGKMPFEIKEVHATADGFELSFTEPVDAATASKIDGYDVAQFTYEYHEKYGSPEFDQEGKPDSSTDIKVTKAVVSEDRQKVRLTLEGLRSGFITMIHSLDATSENGDPLRHDTCWYTLNNIPRP